MASTYLLDEHPQCLSSHSLVQVLVQDVHRIQLLTWGGSYQDISLDHDMGQTVSHHLGLRSATI